MSKVIWKYPVEHHNIRTTFLVPRGAKFMHCGLDTGGQCCVWVLLDPYEAPTTEVILTRVGTGNEMDGVPGAYLTTYVDDPFIWHMFIHVKE